MVYIIPRSWTSGAYFKRFREFFLTEGKIEHIHLFVSRNKVFDKEDVLQETIIVKVRKTCINPKEVTITSSKSNCDFADLTSLTVPYSLVVSGKDYYVYLVTDEKEVEVLVQRIIINWLYLHLILCQPIQLLPYLFHRACMSNGKLPAPC